MLFLLFDISKKLNPTEVLLPSPGVRTVRCLNSHMFRLFDQTANFISLFRITRNNAYFNTKIHFIWISHWPVAHRTPNYHSADKEWTIYRSNLFSYHLKHWFQSITQQTNLFSKRSNWLARLLAFFFFGFVKSPNARLPMCCQLPMVICHWPIVWSQFYYKAIRFGNQIEW